MGQLGMLCYACMCVTCEALLNNSYKFKLIGSDQFLLPEQLVVPQQSRTQTAPSLLSSRVASGNKTRLSDPLSLEIKRA